MMEPPARSRPAAHAMVHHHVQIQLMPQMQHLTELAQRHQQEQGVPPGNQEAPMICLLPWTEHYLVRENIF